MTVLEQLRKTIEDGHPGETEKLVREALKQHIPAGRIVEEAMTPAMRTVGENYKSNGADIIKILAAARSVRKGFELLEGTGLAVWQEEYRNCDPWNGGR